MAKDGISYVLFILLFIVILYIGQHLSGSIVLKVLMVLGVVMLLFTMYFFRDPERTIPEGDNLIVSPADGKIIQIKEVDEQIFFKKKVKMVSIFMSVFNVHVNRIPIDGKVTYFAYQKGKYHPAYDDIASYDNEQSIIGIENDKTKVLFKQIAGILARRIVCHVREGSKVKKGERFGLIKFGSRVDIFLPNDVEIKVKLNEKVTAGETIIGTY